MRRPSRVMMNALTRLLLRRSSPPVTSVIRMFWIAYVGGAVVSTCPEIVSPAVAINTVSKQILIFIFIITSTAALTSSRLSARPSIEVLQRLLTVFHYHVESGN
jgi:hypothetical protein